MIVVVGLSHHTAPIDVRERLALTEEDVLNGLRELSTVSVIAEAFAIATCNRVELIAASRGEGAAAGEQVEAALTSFFLRRSPQAAGHLYVCRESEAVRHLYRVASSLDSLVVGEPQILGQVKQAVEVGRRAGTVGACLQGLANRALRCAKRVRSETAIGAGQVSVPSVAVDLARQIFGELQERSLLLVGTGEMGTTVGKLLVGEGARLTVVGRTHDKALAIASAYGGRARPWAELSDALAEADVVVSSTAAQAPVITRKMVLEACRKRRARSLFLIDVAVPRDVEPGVDDIDEVFLYNVDDLSNVVAGSRGERQQQAALAEDIVAQELAEFARWSEREQVTPAVVALRQHVAAVLGVELERSLKGKLKHLGPAEREALGRMLEAAVNKLMHLPTQRLRSATGEARDELGVEELVRALEQLFGLGGDVGAPSGAEGRDVGAINDDAPRSEGSPRRSPSQDSSEPQSRSGDERSIS